MTIGTNAHPNTEITGPAAIFDATALRSWLAESTSTGPDGSNPRCGDASRADELGLDEFFSRAHGYLLSGLGDLLAALADDQEQTVWRLQPGIEHIRFFRTFDGETEDGAIIVVDLDNGLRLASLHQDHRNFASLESHGLDAAVEALSTLAIEANTIVPDYQNTTGLRRSGTRDIHHESTATPLD